MALLEVKNLGIGFRAWSGEVASAVRSISFSIEPGQGCALVGESGSGKSIIALTLTKLLPEPPAVIQSGEILLGGVNILTASPKELQKVRGKRIAYIFQEPTAALNPVYTVENQISEVLALHCPEINDRRAEIVKLLDEVGIVDPVSRLRAYPHELSGGMQQRVMIAMALAAKPDLLVADEPTTALDVTIQRQIMDLLAQLKRSRGMAILLITHNLGIIRSVADELIVLFRGDIVEKGAVDTILTSPQHPYTQALLQCVPKLGKKRRRLPSIEDFLVSSDNLT
jgi:ABC-type dipeptide/oligopeptide/nickel transport system ATPase component